MNEETIGPDGAIDVEEVRSGDDLMGKIMWRKGHYFFIPRSDVMLAISAPVLKRISDRLELLTETKPTPHETAN